jgi:hypothetical protein
MTDPEDCWPGDPDGDLTAEEYDELLRGYCNDDESPIPGEFIRDLDGVWFTRGGGMDVGANGYHLWHNGMDPIYAAGSCVCAGRSIPLGVLREATDMFKAMLERSNDVFTFSPKAVVHIKWMIDLGEAALAAKPSKEVQYVET